MALAKRAAEARQRRVRTILLTVILITIPFYCVGFVLWASAPQQNRPPTTATTAPSTNTPVNSGSATATNVPGEPSLTPITGGGITTVPITLNPPTSSFPSPTRFITATATRLMTFTPAPPTVVPPTSVPPTAVAPTSDPVLFDTPLPFDELP
ncbi:MAG: hypothetical protein H7175_04840 [Burkholderiales bacterium]|nr:hypothetical protein [Anaerolineae bacterium]